jgi:hypothetical protein
MTIYSPIQLAFIKFLKASITKNKKYGYINLTNKQIAERFEFQDRKYSLDYISKLVQKVKHEFTLQSKGSTRYILLKNTMCQTVQNNVSDNTEQVQSKYTVICQTVQPRQETLEPQGLEDPLLSIKNQDLINKNQDQVKEKSNKKEKVSRNYQYTEEFEEAWCLYGRRGDKKASNDEFELAKKREPHLMEKLRSSIPRYLRTRRVLDGYKRDFERFLKGDMFDSEWQVDFAENVEELQEKYEQNESLSNTLNFLAESKRVQRLQDAMKRGEIQRVA